MDFRLELHIKAFAAQINIRHKVMLMGSCFTDHISNRLKQHKFQVLENPNGILFNPFSIGRAIESYVALHQYRPDDLFSFNGLWASWQYHSQFSHPDQTTCLQQINDSVKAAHHFLKEANWLILTLGSSFVYETSPQAPLQLPASDQKLMVAANCHKVPAPYFHHRLLNYEEVENSLRGTVELLKTFNPNLKIIFTISPVRHHREGLVENNRSKALLHTVVHAMLQNYPHTNYFPSYELVIDDLRDYRFYAEDMVHPNHQATQYVWEKFCEAVIDKESLEIMKLLLPIYFAKKHKPLHASSSQHQQFLKTMHGKVMDLAAQYPFLDFKEEIAYFSGI